MAPAQTPASLPKRIRSTLTDDQHCREPARQLRRGRPAAPQAPGSPACPRRVGPRRSHLAEEDREAESRSTILAGHLASTTPYGPTLAQFLEGPRTSWKEGEVRPPGRPLSVSGMSVVPVCSPLRLQPASPCLIANTFTFAFSRLQTLSASVERTPLVVAVCPHDQPAISGISSP